MKVLLSIAVYMVIALSGYTAARVYAQSASPSPSPSATPEAMTPSAAPSTGYGTINR